MVPQLVRMKTVETAATANNENGHRLMIKKKKALLSDE